MPKSKLVLSGFISVVAWMSIASFAEAQTTSGRGSSGAQTTKSTQNINPTGTPITIGTDYQNINTSNNNNPEQKPIIITALCNSTLGMKVLEGYTGYNQPSMLQGMVVSSNDTNRISITFVVPYGWWYRVSAVTPTGAPASTNPNTSCSSALWLTY